MVPLFIITKVFKNCQVVVFIYHAYKCKMHFTIVDILTFKSIINGRVEHEKKSLDFRSGKTKITSDCKTLQIHHRTTKALINLCRCLG